jgi:hypothetical protein
VRNDFFIAAGGIRVQFEETLIAMQSFRLPSLRLHPLLLCLILSLIYSLPAISQDSDKVEDGSDKKEGITVIVNLAGKVEIIETEGAKPKSAVKGARVPVGATCLVGPGSRLDLALSNGALFQLRENSKFTIGEFEQEAYEFVFTNGVAIRPHELKDFGTDEVVLQTMDASEEAWNKLGSEPTTSEGQKTQPRIPHGYRDAHWRGRHPRNRVDAHREARAKR